MPPTGNRGKGHSRVGEPRRPHTCVAEGHVYTSGADLSSRQDGDVRSLHDAVGTTRTVYLPPRPATAPSVMHRLEAPRPYPRSWGQAPDSQTSVQSPSLTCVGVPAQGSHLAAFRVGCGGTTQTVLPTRLGWWHVDLPISEFFQVVRSVRGHQIDLGFEM